MPAWYPGLLDSVSQHVSTGHRRAVCAANGEMLATYWAIGKEILDRQDRQGWGAKVVARLSADLRLRFPDARGFSPRNLKYMRAFAVAWPESAIVQRSAAQLPWRHHQYLLDKLDSLELREWYARAAVENGWNREALALHIESRLHERTGKAITNFPATLPEPDSDLAQQATKDPYLFDFLTTDDLLRERTIERSLIHHVREFLLEMGRGFAFVGSQIQLDLGDSEFFCDLLFYHVKLHRFVVVELKAARFEPAFLGQLGLYIRAVDDFMAQPGDGPTVGLLLCKSKDDVVAEYALGSYAVPMGVAEYTNAITTSLPDELTANLPTIAELEAELASGGTANGPEA